jgi:hypothetical protein
MNQKLTKTDSEILESFSKLESRSDIAELLEITDKTLIFYLYRKIDNYNIFYLEKKNGEKRKISAPISPIKILQRKLAYVLSLIYEPKAYVNGFCRGKNILKNAQGHIKKRWILNLDLKNFFPSINFGRVRGLFMSNPFNFNEEVATILAQICCFEGSLPQGAPTSPIISNMICFKLDNELFRLAKKYRFYFSRYADDITLSTRSSTISNQIAEISYVDGKPMAIPGESLKKLIDENGFEINLEKIRINSERSRQEVTGIIVNSKPNLKRIFIKQIRAMLHSWEKFNLKKAEEEFSKIHSKPPELFLETLLGKIQFLKNVRGERDKIFRKLVNRYNDLKVNGKPRLPLDEWEEIENCIWIIQCGTKTGSGFFLKDVGIITCQHVIDSGEKIDVFRCNEYPLATHKIASIKKQNKTLDLAILSISNEKSFPALDIETKDPDIGQSLTTIGFPNYRPGDPPARMEMQVRSFRTPQNNIARILVDKVLVAGESGSPALNKNNKVVGIVVTGVAHTSQLEIAEFSLIPIKALEFL